MISEMVSALLILALAILGVPYGQCIPREQVTGTMAIGSFYMAWDYPCTCSDPRTVCKNQSVQPKDHRCGGTKGIPRYTSVRSFTLMNLGSIPVRLTGQKVVPASITTTTEKDKSDGGIWVSFKDDLPSVVTPKKQRVSDLEIIIGESVQLNSTFQF
jgi:hypothetical protein